MMKKVTSFAFIAALALSSTAPAMADAVSARPAAVAYAAPAAASFSTTPTELGVTARSSTKMKKKSDLFGAFNLSAFLPFLAALFGFPSVQAFIDALNAAYQSPQ